MHGTRTIESNGIVTDQYFAGKAPEGLMQKDGAASVAATAGYAVDYGRGKCSVTVTLQCDQNSAAITQAFHLAFDAARTMAIDGMQTIAQDAEFAKQQAGGQ